jgi:cell wall-associated NlpC family hydrolase
MSRLSAIAVLLCAALLGACGDAAPSARIAAWELPPPYLPPPDPSLLASGSAQTANQDVAPVGSSTPASSKPAAGRRPTASAQRRPSATRRAPARTRAVDEASASGAPTDAEVAADLREAFGGKAGTNVDMAAIDASGLAIIPPSAPSRLAALIRGANEVARKPYVYGGGHGRNPDEIRSDSAYDCSGSVSYALATAGYIKGPMVSGALASWGKPGPGKWVTIYANDGHAFMVVAGLRFDTSGRQRTGTRWQSASARSYAGFTARHPPGL